MKYKLLFILSCLLISTFSYSQIKIGTNPQNLNSASVLELESTSRALVLTRVNSTQMNAITPLQGALVYNTDSKCIHYYDGTQWLNLCDALTSSGNISLVDNGDGTYTFSDANNNTTLINNLNESLVVENGNLILTDSSGNSISVELQNLDEQTFTTDAIINTFPTIFITQDANGTNFNFEVGVINGENIQDGSIKQADLAGSSVGTSQLRDNSVRNVAMADNAIGSPEIIDGSIQPIDIGPGTNNQILTTNDAGAVQWTDQAGLVSADEVSYDNATSSLSATNVQDALDEVNAANTTINLLDNGDGTYTFTKSDGTTVTIEDTSISTLMDNGNGTYTYTDETGTTQTINTNGFTITNLISGNRIATITKPDGTTNNINETITTVTGTAATGKLIATYNNENGSAVVINETVTSISDTNDGFITYTNENGTVQKVNKSNVIDNGNGTYSFTNNDGSDVTIDTNGIAITNVIAGNLIATVTNAAGTAIEIDETLTDISGTLTTGNEIGIYSNENGSTVSIQETITGISDLGDGKITFNGEDGLPVTVDKADVTDNGNGTYTFTNNDGSDVTIDTRAISNPYTPSSGLTSTNVQGAIDELAISNAADNDMDPTNELSDVALTGTTIGLTNPTAGATGVDLDLTFATDAELATVQADVDANETAANNAISTLQADVDQNEADADTAISLKEDAANKSDNTTLGNSAILFPTQNAVKTYVDTQVATITTDDDITDVNFDGTFLTVEEGATSFSADLSALEESADIAAVQADVDANETAANNAISTLQADVDQNEADADTAIALKENAANKSIDDTFATADNVNFPTQLAVKTYVDGQVAASNQTIVSADANNVISAGADGGAFYNDATIQSNIATNTADISSNDTDIANNATAIATKENSANKSSDDTFATADNVNFPTQLAVKSYVDNEITASNQTIVSTDANNVIAAGADGGAFYDDATIQSNIATNTADISSNDTDIANNTAAIATKEDSANKSIDDTFATADNVNFPTQLAVKTYVDTQMATVTTDDDITAVNFDGTDLTVQEGATSFSADLSALEESADISAVQADVDANETAANNAIATLQSDVDQNEADADSAIALKEDSANKSDNTALGNSAILFPTQNAVKTYVDNEITASNQTIVSTDANNVISTGVDGGAFYDDATIQANIASNSVDISSNDTDIANNTAAIATKEDSANKSDNTALGNSATLFPTQNAVKTYVDNEIMASNQTIVSTDANNVIAAGADGGAFYDDATIQANIATNTADISSNDTDIANNATAIATKENSANKSIDDTFATADNVNFPTQLAVKTYVDGQIAASNQTIVSTDANNVISTGVDGGAFYDDATIQSNIAINTADISSNDTDIANNATAIATKENSANKSIDDTFATADNVNFPTQLAVKTYVDTQVATITTDDDITAVNFDGTDLTVQEGATSFSANLSALEESADIAAVQSDVDINETAANNAIATLQSDVDQNEADADTAIALKEDSANKSIDDTFATADNVNFPTQLAVKTYVDNEITASNQTIVSTDANNVIAAGADGGAFYDDATIQANIATNSFDISSNDTDIANNSAAIATKEDAANKSIDDTFATADNVSFPTQLAVKTYVDGQVAASNTLASANIFVGDALNTAQEVNLNGDATLDNTGLLTISNNAVTTAKIADNNITTAKILDANVTLGKLADGTAAGQLMQWNGTNWVLVDETTLSSTETNTTLTQDTSTGIATYIGEDATPQSINIISSDSGNSISAGSDGGAYYRNPAGVYGKYNSSTNVVSTSGGVSAFAPAGIGRFVVTLSTPRTSAEYVIQLTLFHVDPNESIDIFISDQTTTTFTVEIVRDNNGTFNSYVNRTFYFTILDY